ncbi:glucose 1-dehydrogenase/3-oxoacyl-[acyl-carrier protein] reductase [Haloactinopolyspora alba]|uniref:Glucose 1-dehydrogenase/3-oxoacyl-[acyl-carrier protein] reductase n=1 Tax=Haloactinopolyspora alba TaxID=648780 RepID=A0A2P8EG08_9ACTN|nr:glucose 1-dehydrogenase [Haloactinopolyspora alba]PSL08406.1 glucose 1-dehydrogenase/3-oxoacyl-[acyl-carrier protein] reductase [Haloactinopolyspora alba]
MARLNGQVAVVTGAGGGIGRAISVCLASEGAHVLAVDVDEAGARQTVSAVEDAGGKAVAEVADITDRAARDGVVPAALERFGRVDVLVNNAAYQGRRLPFLDVPADEWDRVLATNLTAAAALAQDAARYMVARGSGTIVNVTAIQERLPMVTHAAYGVSKGGVSALTRSLAVELSPLGVRVNAVAPGMISTPSLRASQDVADAVVTSPGRSPTLLGRDGAPEELAAAVAFLASSDSSFVTGEVLTVDGGRTLSRRFDALAAQHDPVDQDGPDQTATEGE